MSKDQNFSRKIRSTIFFIIFMSFNVEYLIVYAEIKKESPYPIY